MHNSNIGGKQPYDLYKHMYNFFMMMLHANQENNVFIYKKYMESCMNF